MSNEDDDYVWFLDQKEKQFMEMQPVESSNISSIGWDAEHGLRVTFRPSGTTYEYPAVPFNVFDDFRQSSSKGRFFAANIKGKYESVKI